MTLSRGFKLFSFLMIATVALALASTAPAAAADTAAAGNVNTSAHTGQQPLFTPEHLLMKGPALSFDFGGIGGVGAESCFGNCTCTSCNCSSGCSVSQCQSGCNDCFDQIDPLGCSPE